MRGTGFGLERSVLCGTTIGVAPRWEAMLERAIAVFRPDSRGFASADLAGVGL